MSKAPTPSAPHSSLHGPYDSRIELVGAIFLRVGFFGCVRRYIGFWSSLIGLGKCRVPRGLGFTGGDLVT